MSITSYKELLQFSSQIKIENKLLSYILEDLDIVNNQPFITKHFLFYPKGIFSEKYLDAYFFEDNDIHVIKFRKDVTSIKSVKLEQIKSVNLDIQGYKDYVLMIKLKNEEDIIFDAKGDSNEHNMHSFSENIAKIHRYIITGKHDKPTDFSSTNPW
ncbi:hypothetical protein [Sporolactobacillus laevolacticus]|uniref:hypothetical protein n=1 Tax=Sporolactobacillus laevolacticus TaxID=33018 RepID=UPI0025B39364|nr:hypothetical protein [Sporolactobacillus laevolacticus]MDN3956169.1 hypothetical protein [Sporolactobacillus laevolacticus]